MTPGIASGVAPRDARNRRAWLGGFNLLPYRARDARRARRRVLGELAAAACAGIAGVALWRIGRTFERARYDAQRALMERQLAAWAPQLKAAEQAARKRDAERERTALAAERAVPRQRTVDLFDTLRQLRYDGVRLRSIRCDGHDALLEASALDSASAERWLRDLDAAQRGWTTEVAGLQAARTSWGREAAGGRSLSFSVRIRWPAGDRGRVASVAARAQAVAREGA
ncbi:fimbrial protein [Burkholderia thailandensis]|uniref:fimbrial protein n=1 Tax=Burkholderia thailandensis TaxID=57975 RepID=UPI0012E98ADC|nr:fimbrial protein [Burkholderia thailandensis]MUV26437.1 fimbrial protein [Burkholderia thailandensis]